MENLDDAVGGDTRRSMRVNKGQPPQRYGDAVDSTLRRRNKERVEVQSEGSSHRSFTTIVPAFGACQEENTKETTMEDTVSILKDLYFGTGEEEFENRHNFGKGSNASDCGVSSHLTKVLRDPDHDPQSCEKRNTQGSVSKVIKSIPSICSSTKVRQLEFEKANLIAMQDLELRKKQVELEVQKIENEKQLVLLNQKLEIAKFEEENSGGTASIEEELMSKQSRIYKWNQNRDEFRRLSDSQRKAVVVTRPREYDQMSIRSCDTVHSFGHLIPKPLERDAGMAPKTPIGTSSRFEKVLKFDDIEHNSNIKHKQNFQAPSKSSSDRKEKSFEHFMHTLASAVKGSSENAQISAQINAETMKANAETIKVLLSRQGGSKDLPVFAGDPTEWPSYYQQYVDSTKLCGFSDQENFMRLQK
ncbi:unnamed protein product, partial [Allacma fusca]